MRNPPSSVGQTAATMGEIAGRRWVGVRSGDRAAIAVLVEKCLEAKGVGCKACETEINERIAALYSL